MVASLTDQITAAETEYAQLLRQEKAHRAKRELLQLEVNSPLWRRTPYRQIADLHRVQCVLNLFPARLHALQERIQQLIAQRALLGPVHT